MKKSALALACAGFRTLADFQRQLSDIREQVEIAGDPSEGDKVAIGLALWTRLVGIDKGLHQQSGFVHYVQVRQEIVDLVYLLADKLLDLDIDRHSAEHAHRLLPDLGLDGAVIPTRVFREDGNPWGGHPRRTGPARRTWRTP